MKITTEKRTKTIVGILTILLTFTLAATGCQKDDTQNPDNGNSQTADNTENTGLEIGFTASGAGSSELSHRSACRSTKTDFDINNVTLEFYYGTVIWAPVEFIRENSISIPAFELRFKNDDDDIHIIKQVNENFISEKYDCNYNTDTNRYDFNYSETLTIPKELFNKKNGYIEFYVYGIDIHAREPKEMIITGFRIFYNVSDGNVTLSYNSKG